MCGIFGLIAGKNAAITAEELNKGIEKLLLLSESRGKEASGICAITDTSIRIHKRCVRAKELIRTGEYREIMSGIDRETKRTVMGHARMVTNGSSHNPNNNQPVIRGDFVCIHNGIIVNDEAVWKDHPEMVRQDEVDTEVLLALLQKYGAEGSIQEAFQKCLKELKGSLSIALIDKRSDRLLLYTNVGSLYIVLSKTRDMILFASERYILEKAVTGSELRRYFRPAKIRQVPLKRGWFVNLSDCSIIDMKRAAQDAGKAEYDREIICTSGREEKRVYAQMVSPGRVRQVEKLLCVDTEKIDAMRRCTRCLLPETFPGISFDEEGVCSVCRSYKKIEYKGQEKLLQEIKKNVSDKSRFDCIIPLSGGRDSCYMIHYAVKELGLRPVAYTYDWGMVTDLARRNIQRMCSELGVEHILISADIARKRKNVQLNVKAWLKHPELFTIPLFMAGDKQFFYYAQLLKKQMNVGTILFGMNWLEETQFKVKFANIKETGKNEIYYDLSGRNKVNLMSAYGKEFVRNPAYLNRSLVDTFSGYLSYYILPKNYLQFFDYIPWEQKKIEKVILEEYDWEKAKGRDETWRIGDGTAPFYNYIYLRLAGFTEFDTFKSNQIREGMIARETALEELKVCNMIPVDEFIWYCDTINIDPVETLKIINAQKTLY
ncbi:MAG: hypothetical protein HDR16_02460 [Lachnospiraceae bacterium]|nr:hypothetical protein [Lachnospiraceae bacterium]